MKVLIFVSADIMPFLMRAFWCFEKVVVDLQHQVGVSLIFNISPYSYRQQ